MTKQQIRNSFLLLLAACVWGVAFVAQSVAMDYVGPFTFSCARFLLGGAVLLPVIGIFSLFHKNKSADTVAQTTPNIASNASSDSRLTFWQRNKTLIIGGICCGSALCIANNLQQVGIVTTSAGKAGFITAFYIVFVPILSLFFGKKSRLLIWISVILALAGLYLLCVTESFSINHGDIYIMICAFVFSAHILIIDHFSPLVDGVKLSCIQFFVAGILSAIPMLLFENPSFTQLQAASVSILYAGIMSCGVAYTLQVVGQKNMNPTIASLILSLESVVSVLAGWIILNQTLSTREIIGCVLMFGAIILAQLPEKKSLLHQRS